MEIRQGLEGLRALPPEAVVSIGNFDGIHRGHQQIIETGRKLCARSPGRALAVVTFEPHPLTVLRPGMAPPRLTPPDLKQALLTNAGVDVLVILPPEPAVLNLTAEEFWRILRDEVRPSSLIEGPEFNFGKGRGGNIEKLLEWTEQSSVRLVVVEPVRITLLDRSIVPVSSSVIRWLIAHGRVRDAALCLGRPYLLQGPVIEGRRRGRELGIPTANLDCSDQLVPADGVYVARCRLGGTTYPVALSIGTMPTFNDTLRQIEAHLIGFSGDLYGQTLQVEVLDWLRDQQKFPGLEALKRQLERDIAAAIERQSLDLVSSQ